MEAQSVLFLLSHCFCFVCSFVNASDFEHISKVCIQLCQVTQVKHQSCQKNGSKFLRNFQLCYVLFVHCIFTRGRENPARQKKKKILPDISGEIALTKNVTFLHL